VDSRHNWAFVLTAWRVVLARKKPAISLRRALRKISVLLALFPLFFSKVI
jgi:hypothetical protein